MAVGMTIAAASNAIVNSASSSCPLRSSRWSGG
ncbi:MAG: hypothetical protein AAGA68_24075 [Pseudomonadota bacterium]